MPLLTFVLPPLWACFVWWFTTGLIMAVYGRSPRTIRLGFAGLTLLLGTAIGGIILTRQADQPWAVYVAFTCGALVWGWQMASYYLGFVTGPATTHGGVRAVTLFSRPAQVLLLRFRLALRASLHHELVVIGFALLLVGLTWSYANRWGLWSFLTLWLMHGSAKLNVFFGVRNFRIDFLPPHLHALDALLAKRPVNLFFPFSVVAASAVALFLLAQAFAPATEPGQVTGLLLVSTMILLGVVEHWLLVLPLPAILWGWGVRPLPQPVGVEESELRRHQSGTIRPLPEQMSES
jgi:putative photosynthetic complex assembly protein 2